MLREILLSAFYSVLREILLNAFYSMLRERMLFPLGLASGVHIIFFIIPIYTQGVIAVSSLMSLGKLLTKTCWTFSIFTQGCKLPLLHTQSPAWKHCKGERKGFQEAKCNTVSPSVMCSAPNRTTGWCRHERGQEVKRGLNVRVRTCYWSQFPAGKLTLCTCLFLCRK